MIGVKVKVTTKGKGDAEQWARNYEKLAQEVGVKVGLPGGKADTTVVEYAIYNHFGTAGRTPRRGGWGGPIPARPFITVAMFRFENKFRTNLLALHKAVLAGRTDTRTGLAKVAQAAVGEIQATIAAGLPPANSELTIKMKGSGKNTLNDSGRMRASVTWTYADSGGLRGRRLGKTGRK